nr:aldo/keto reductase [Bacillus sp. FJAT-50079]
MDVSILSYGASSLGSVFRAINEKEGIRTVHEAVDRGINMIDVSPYYGLTKAETVLGKALKELSRDSYFLSSKAGRYGDNTFDFSKRSIIKSAEESLKRLNTDYLDILLLHDIEFGHQDEVIDEGIEALIQLKRQGKIRFFGVSALPLSIFEKIIEKTELDVILSYCHYSLNDTSLLSLLPKLEQNGIGLINASPLSMGLLSTNGPPTWHPANEKIKEICKKALLHCKNKGENLSKLAIQYAVQNERIPTTLVGTASAENIKRNIDWVNEPINKELLQEVLEILEPIHNQTWQSGAEEKSK